MKKLFLIGSIALSVFSASAAYTREWQGNMPKPVGKLPSYPPIVCVAPNWEVESCESRRTSLPAPRPNGAPLVLPDEIAIYYEPGYFPALGFVDRSALFYMPDLPPVEYDHPYQGRLRIINIDDQETVVRMCRLALTTSHKIRYVNSSIPQNTIACAIRRSVIELDPNADCVIFMAKKLWASNLVMRHEIGHCNGWDSHDGMRGNLSPEELEREIQRDLK